MTAEKASDFLFSNAPPSLHSLAAPMRSNLTAAVLQNCVSMEKASFQHRHLSCREIVLDSDLKSKTGSDYAAVSFCRIGCSLLIWKVCIKIHQDDILPK